MIESIIRFFKQAYFSYKSLVSWLDIKIFMLVKVLKPTFQFMFYCLLARFVNPDEDITRYVVGNTLLLCTSSALFSAGVVMIQERYYGTLKLLVVSSTNNFTIFTGRALFYIIDGIFTIFVGFLLGFLFFGLDFSKINILLLSLVIFVCLFALFSFGLFISSLGLVTRDVNMLLNCVTMIIIAVSGANFPIERLPAAIQKVSWALPLTRSINSTNMLFNGAGFNDISFMLYQEILVGSFYMLIGYALFAVMEKMARRKATLDIY